MKTKWGRFPTCPPIRIVLCAAIPVGIRRRFQEGRRAAKPRVVQNRDHRKRSAPTLFQSRPIPPNNSHPLNHIPLTPTLAIPSPCYEQVEVNTRVKTKWGRFPTCPPIRIVLWAAIPGGSRTFEAAFLSASGRSEPRPSEAVSPDVIPIPANPTKQPPPPQPHPTYTHPRHPFPCYEQVEVNTRVKTKWGRFPTCPPIRIVLWAAIPGGSRTFEAAFLSASGRSEPRPSEAVSPDVIPIPANPTKQPPPPQPHPTYTDTRYSPHPAMNKSR